MSLPHRTHFLFLAVLTGLLLVWGAVRAAPTIHEADAQTAAVASSPTPLPDRPTLQAPDISFIDSPTASCVVPTPHTGICYLRWSYLYATADPNYIISMTVEIDGKARARYAGFFQTSMYVPDEMLIFGVACGAAGSGGNPNFGMSHSYTIRARDSSGFGAANYGSVTCPADEPHHVYLPVVRK